MNLRRSFPAKIGGTLAMGVLCVSAAAAQAPPERLLLEPVLDAGTLPEGWQYLELPRRAATSYESAEMEGRAAMVAHADDSAGGLFRRTEIDLEQTSWLRWNWRIEETLAGPVDERARDDYPVRLFAVFAPEDWRGEREVRLRDLSRLLTICYVWAPSSVPAGHIYDSPYQDNVRMIAVRSGDTRAGGWVEESRDMRADFERAFGQMARRVVAVGLMTDTDDTEAVATAWYGSISVGSDASSGRR